MPIAEWLQSVGLEKYVALFEEHEITVDVLPHLTDADIASLNLPIGPRRRLTVEIRRLAAAAGGDRQAAESVRVDARELHSAGAERRQLTVMFCDLVGSTSLAELLDPEELRELLQTYRKACSDAAARYDGHVAQYLGDGLMIYFGWPSAHEDDAERSVRAALDMVDAVKGIASPQPMAIRIGLATGPVVVGDSSQQDSTEARLAVGETPNLAARLQSLAGVNEVVMAAATRRLVGDTFALTDLGSRSVKGIAEPVRAWRVDEVQRTTGRFESRHAGVELTPLVGREDEAALLLRRWHQARDGEGQIVLLGGEPGIGKSRLTQVVRQRAVEPHTMLRYQCSPYHLHSALHPIIEQFEFAAGFARDDTPDQKLDKMEALLAGTPAQIADAAPLFATMLSLPASRYQPSNLSPQRQKEKLLDAIATQVAVLAQVRPVLMVFEDLHWADPTSQEMLDVLAARIPGLPVLFIGTHRPEYVPPWTGQAGVTSLPLSRLGRRLGAQLVERVTEGRQLPTEVLDEILARTDGVPLYVEELTKSVLESGVLRRAGDRYVLQGPLSALAIPATLRDSLVARLDRLAPIKEIAQIGACIGREFSCELLARVAAIDGQQLESALDRLADAGLVVRRGEPPEATYTFKHALVQDAAYDSLLKSRRTQLHAAIARVLEHDFAERVANKPEWLAHHHTLAGNSAAAIPLWRRAGELALDRVALNESVAHFQKGLGLIEQQPASSERDELELTIRDPLNAAWVGLRGWAAPEIDSNTRAILRLAKAQHNARSVLLGLWWIWTSTITQGRIEDSLQWAEQLLAEARETGDLDFEIFGHAATMVSHMILGRVAESRQHADRVLALYDPARAEQWIQLTGHDLRTFIEVYACQLIWIQGYPDQAKQLSDRSRADAHTVANAFNLVWAQTFSAYVFAYRREPARLLELVTEADRLALDQGLAFFSQVSVPQAIGVARLQEGRLDEAITLLRGGIESWSNVGGRVRIPFLKSALAEATARRGDVDAALELVDECIEQIDRPGWRERLWLPEVLRLEGWMLMLQGRHEEAEARLRESIDCARRQEARSWELRSATTLATCLAARGEPGAARDLLQPVYAWFTEGFDSPDLCDARTVLQQLSAPAPVDATFTTTAGATPAAFERSRDA